MMTLRTCVKRSAFSLHWEQTPLSFATINYLTTSDVLDMISILDVAQGLKLKIIDNAITILKLIHSDWFGIKS